MRGEPKDVSPLQLVQVREAALDLAAFAPVGARLANGLRNLLGQFAMTTTVTAGKLERIAAHDAEHAGVAIAVPELGCDLVLALPTPFVVVLIDRLYGGSAALQPMERPLTSAETRVLTAFAAQFVPVLASALAERVAVAPRLRSDGGGAEVAPRSYAQGFAVGSEAGDVDVRLILPEAALLAILGPATSRPEPARTAIWSARLTDAVLHAHLPVRTILARPELPLERLLRLAPGDVIPVRLPALVPVSAAGRLIGHGSIGEANGRAAVKIEQMERGFAA